MDPHTLCSVCRRNKNGHDCTPETTCRQCALWDEAQWERFLSRRTYAERKRKSSSVPPSSAGSSVEKPVRSSSKTPTKPPVSVTPKLASSLSVGDTAGVSPLPAERRGSSHRPPTPAGSISPREKAVPATPLTRVTGKKGGVSTHGDHRLSSSTGDRSVSRSSRPVSRSPPSALSSRRSSTTKDRRRRKRGRSSSVSGSDRDRRSSKKKREPKSKPSKTGKRRSRLIVSDWL